MKRSSRHPIPVDLQDVQAIAIAWMTCQGNLLAANAGFRRLLLKDENGSTPRNVSSFFIKPDFRELTSAPESKGDKILHHGFFTVGSEALKTCSLKGKLMRKDNQLYFFAEHTIEEMEALQHSVLDLNTALTDSQRKLSQANRALQHRLINGSLKLQKREELLDLMGKVFANAGEGIFITDADNRIVQINTAFSRLTGYSEDEVTGKKLKFLIVDDIPQIAYRNMLSALADRGSWQGELAGRKRSGETYPIWLSINVMLDRSGATTHYIGSFSDISERKASEAKLLHMAYHDALTQLPNRLNLNESLTQLLWSAQQAGAQAAVLVIDLDQFKTVNDTLGHHVGDQLLVEVASRMRHAIRNSDIVARFGGDEFVVVLSGMDSPHDAEMAARKIIRMVSMPYWIAGNELLTSPSIGISVFPEDATKPGDLIRYADVAMYDAKARGRGLYRFYSKEMSQANNARLAMETELRKALEHDQFVLHYQPQLNLRSGKLSGVEALVRWQHPRRGIVYPAEFISLAEELGLISELGDWVLNEACRQLGIWHEEGIVDIRMSVNLSASQFRNKYLSCQIQNTLAHYGLRHDSLELEVTESIAMESPGDAIIILKQLEDAGIFLSIDDFGTGYSSLAYLKLFPLHTLKIDCSFVKDIETNANDAEICDMIVVLAHKLGLEVIAEGVETKEQLRFLSNSGCEKIQGFLLSKPLSADLATRFIHEYHSARITT